MPIIHSPMGSLHVHSADEECYQPAVPIPVRTPWIGVDFDGTVAEDETCLPVPKMVARIKRWLAAGIKVKILTARVATYYPNPEREQHRAFVQKWTLVHIGTQLEVTSEKDFDMYQLWDDRAIQVIKNTGERVGDVNRASDKFVGKDLIDEESGFCK